jgi:ABC-type phosphate/phosphonate transport system permease subunit
LEQDETPYCREFTKEETATRASKALSTTAIIILNGMVAKVFKYLGEYQKKPTMIEQNQTCFEQIMLMEFFNTGLVILIISFSKLSGFFSKAPDPENVVRTKYDGFESDWYADVGKTLVITLSLTCFISNSLDMRKFVDVMIKRFRDRGHSPYLKKYPEDEEDDQPNTVITSQRALEVLYEGENFENDKALSRMMSTFLVVMFFSGGMPMMYIFGFAFFLSTYIVNKVLLIQFYKKTLTFTREIPEHCVSIFKYAIFLKLFAGLFMFLNPKILKLKDNQDSYFEQRFTKRDDDSIYMQHGY